MIWVNAFVGSETRDRHAAFLTGATEHSRHLRRFLYFLPELDKDRERSSGLEDKFAEKRIREEAMELPG